MLSYLLAHKILTAVVAALLALTAVVAYQVHQAHEYQRRYEKGIQDLNNQKPPTNYTLP